jgi:hypothetical protein
MKQGANLLPSDIINFIKEFIPLNKLAFVNKTYYNLYHYSIKKTIPLYENYIRDIISRDNEFVFEQIVQDNIDLWVKNKTFMYKNMIFNNYIYFIMHFCIENNSEKCREILLLFLLKRDLCRNLHKKNVIKYIKWKN